MSQVWAFCGAADRSQRRRLLDAFAVTRVATGGDKAAAEKLVKTLAQEKR